jgi:hypothetical protein
VLLFRHGGSPGSCAFSKYSNLPFPANARRRFPPARAG